MKIGNRELRPGADITPDRNSRLLRSAHFRHVHPVELRNPEPDVFDFRERRILTAERHQPADSGSTVFHHFADPVDLVKIFHAPFVDRIGDSV